MKVVVLSDLHIDDNSDWIGNLNEALKRIKNITMKNEKIIFILLGDIVNGFLKRTTDDIKRFYKKADTFIHNINDGLVENQVEFYFIPGNHDLDGDSLGAFNEFIERHSRINESKYEFKSDESIFTFDIEGFRFILVDSNLSRDYNASGKIDGELLKKKGATDKQILLFMHHPPSTRETYSDYDDKALDNPLDIMFLHAKYVFYGHQHGDHKEDWYKDRNTIYVPVTGLFNKGSNIRNGFAVLDIQENEIISCYQYEYDGTKFHKIIISPEKSEKRISELIIETHDYSEELQNTIFRHYYQDDSINESFDLVDIVRENDFVIITGEPGIGKTYESHRLYQQYKFDEEYYPILIDLRCTTLEAINRYIEYACKYRIENKDVLLIVDGVSESTSSVFTGLISSLISFPDENLCIKVVITKRDNYVIRFLDLSYQTFHISVFNDEEIKEYLTIRKVQDIQRLMHGIVSSKYKKVIGIPFILKAVTDIYIKKGNIPRFENLMHHIIELQFIEADTSHNNEYKIMPLEYDVITSLEKLGFVMQSICEQPLENIHYTQLFDEKIQSLQSYTGLLYKDYNYRRYFKHEIFGEYFISDYICNLELSKIIDIITYQINGRARIKKAWYDVVRQIIDMRQDGDLLDWILNNDNDILIYYVPEKMMCNSESVYIVELVLKNCFTKNLPIHTVITDIERFVSLHSSKAMWEMITHELFQPHNEYGLSTVLQILRCANSTDIELERIQVKLLEIIKDDHPKYIKSLALSALTKLTEHVDQYIETIIDAFSDETDMSILINVFSIIQNSTNPDKFFEFTIDRFENVDRSYIYFRFDETFLSVLASMKSTEIMVKSIEYMCKSNAFDRIYNNIWLFEAIVDKITKRAMDEDNAETIFNEMYDCFILASHDINGRKTELIRLYFEKTNKLEEALYRIVIDNTMNFYSSFESIIDSTLLDKLIDYYYENVFSEEKFRWYIDRYSVNEESRNKLKEAYKTKHGKDIELTERSSWAIKHEEGEREYFNSLFDKGMFIRKISELVSLIGNDILIAEFFEKGYAVIPEDRQDLQMIGGLIHRFADDLEIHFTDFLTRYKWDVFQYYAILEHIESKDRIVLKDTQRKFLLDKYNYIIANTDFENISSESYNSMDLRLVVTLISKYDFECDDEKLLEMLLLPWHIFASSTVSGSSEVLKFIEKHIKDKDKLHDRIIFNLENKSLNIYAQETHISYCHENRLPNAIASAVELFNSTENKAEYRKHIAIQYLLQCKGEEFVDSLITSDTEDTILEYLSTHLKEHNQYLIKEMITRNQSNNDYFLFIRELVILNNSYGLKRYVDFVKDKMIIPELYDKAHSNLDITMQIRNLSDDSLIDDIMELFSIAYSEGFRDKEDVWGLKGNLDNTITKLCSIYPDKMNLYLNKELDMAKEHSNEELVFRCNYYLSICDAALSNSNESTWTFKQAYQYICDRRNNRN